MSATRFPTATIYHKYACTYIYIQYKVYCMPYIYAHVRHINPGPVGRPFVYAAVSARLIQH